MAETVQQQNKKVNKCSLSEPYTDMFEQKKFPLCEIVIHCAFVVALIIYFLPPIHETIVNKKKSYHFHTQKNILDPVCNNLVFLCIVYADIYEFCLLKTCFFIFVLFCFDAVDII